MKNQAGVIVLLLAFYACSHKGKQNMLVELDSRVDKNSETKELALNIVGVTESDSTYIYKARSLYQSSVVGLEIGLQKNIKAPVGLEGMFIDNGVLLVSSGIESDNLLKAMCELFGFDAVGPFKDLSSMPEFYAVDSVGNIMRSDTMVLTCGNPGKQDIDYKAGAYNFKVFMNRDDNYTELFINFDFANQLILLKVKDLHYRKGIIQYLMKKPQDATIAYKANIKVNKTI